jgi:hypothetical protein
MSRHDAITRAWRPRGAALALLALFTPLCLACPALANRGPEAGDGLGARSPDYQAGDGLSDAAKETAKPSAEQRVLRADDEHHHHGDDGLVGGEIDIPIGQPHCESPVDFGWRFPHKIHVTPMAARSQLASPDFGSSQLLGLRLGVGDPRRTSFDVGVMAGAARFTAGSDMERLLRRPQEFAGEISVRHALTAYDAPVRVAPLLGFRAGALTWDYLNGIWLESEGEVFQVQSDRIMHYSPFAGAALTFGLSEHIELGGTLLGGWRFYDSHSEHGLRNDLFLDTGFTEIRFETRFVF